MRAETVCLVRIEQSRKKCNNRLSLKYLQMAVPLDLVLFSPPRNMDHMTNTGYEVADLLREEV